MSFEQISYLAQIVASVGVVVSLIFVGLQIRQNTGALQRKEHNSAMAQWTVVRRAIAKNRDIAELMTLAFRESGRALDYGCPLRPTCPNIFSGCDGIHGPCDVLLTIQ
jgi:hypothetical protein